MPSTPISRRVEHTLEVCVSDSIDEVEGIKVPTPDTVEVCETTNVQAVPMVDMQVVLSPTVPVAPVGSTVQYHFDLVDRAPDGVGGLTATGIVFSDELDGNVQFQQVTPRTLANTHRAPLRASLIRWARANRSE